MINKNKAKLCCNCEHFKKGFTEESNPTGMYCEVTQWAVGVVHICDRPHRFRLKESEE